MIYVTHDPHEIEIKTYRNEHVADLETIAEAIEFFLDNLLKRCTLEYRLRIKVYFRTGITNSKKQPAYGQAWTTVGKDGVATFHIELESKMPFLCILATLAHEVTHVTQFATGRLQSVSNEWFWEGKSYGFDPYSGEEAIDTQLPWEYHADCKEVELVRKFVKQYYSNW